MGGLGGVSNEGVALLTLEGEPPAGGERGPKAIGNGSTGSTASEIVALNGASGLSSISGKMAVIEDSSSSRSSSDAISAMCREGSARRGGEEKSHRFQHTPRLGRAVRERKKWN